MQILLLFCIWSYWSRNGQPRVLWILNYSMALLAGLVKIRVQQNLATHKCTKIIIIWGFCIKSRGQKWVHMRIWNRSWHFMPLKLLHKQTPTTALIAVSFLRQQSGLLSWHKIDFCHQNIEIYAHVNWSNIPSLLSNICYDRK